MEQQDEHLREETIKEKRGSNDEKLFKRISESDKAHLRILQKIAPRGVIPNLRQIGTLGMRAILILIQHADSDPSFQRLALANLKVKLKKGEVNGRQYALLFDRVLRHEGKPQRFGTQFARVEGSLELEPVENRTKLAARRRAIGLMPLRYYTCVLAYTYRIPIRRRRSTGESQKE